MVGLVTVSLLLFSPVPVAEASPAYNWFVNPESGLLGSDDDLTGRVVLDFVAVASRKKA
jgi:hypothetical protein